MQPQCVLGAEAQATQTLQAPRVDTWALCSSLKIWKSLPNSPTNIVFQSICHFDQFIWGLNIFDCITPSPGAIHAG